MISELHKDVLKLLGFEVVINAVGTVWLEDKNGFMYKNGERWSSPSAAACRTEADAWAQAPTLATLCKPLMLALMKPPHALAICIADGVIHAEHVAPQGVACFADTLDYAIATLFISACKNGLIDPATDVMP